MVVVDTHAWLWWVNESPRLSRVAKRVLEQDGVRVPAISCWEAASLMGVGGRDAVVHASILPLEWLRAALAWPSVELAPITPEIAARAAGLGWPLSGDPADRLIVATALELRAPLITADQRIAASGLVETVW